MRKVAGQVGVIVQEYIKADKSGIIFTKNPVTHRNEILIEYCHGNLEKLVSGRANPISLRYPGNIPQEMQEVVQQAKTIEAYFQSPQDIEWGMQKKKIYIFQSRSITT